MKTGLDIWKEWRDINTHAIGIDENNIMYAWNDKKLYKLTHSRDDIHSLNALSDSETEALFDSIVEGRFEIGYCENGNLNHPYHVLHPKTNEIIPSGYMEETVVYLAVILEHGLTKCQYIVKSTDGSVIEKSTSLHEATCWLHTQIQSSKKNGNPPIRSHWVTPDHPVFNKNIDISLEMS